MKNLADFILLHILYEVFRLEGFDKPLAVANPVFKARFAYFHTLDLSEVEGVLRELSEDADVRQRNAEFEERRSADARRREEEEQRRAQPDT